MKVEIWSDVVCPWCYIGKRRFELALDQFEHKSKIEIEWKSFQLDPTMETNTSISVYQYLADKKGITLDHAQQMGDQVTSVASELGLEYNIENAIPVNTLKAHEVLHFAKDYNKQDELKELLLKAYFIESKNLDDEITLIDIAKNVQLDTQLLKKALDNRTYAKAVQDDIVLGKEFGLQGVPFFVFNRKYGISGAQEVKAFQETLNESFNDWYQEKSNEKLQMKEGKACSTDGGNCD